jgi:hypothetical protein
VLKQLISSFTLLYQYTLLLSVHFSGHLACNSLNWENFETISKNSSALVPYQDLVTLKRKRLSLWFFFKGSTTKEISNGS